MSKIYFVSNLLFYFIFQQSFSQHCTLDSDINKSDLNSIFFLKKKCKVSPKIKQSSLPSNDHHRFLKKRNKKLSNTFIFESENLAKNLKASTKLDISNIKRNIATISTKLLDANNDKLINFTDIDFIPLFDQADRDSGRQYDNFNQKMQHHINKHFLYPKTALKRNIEGVVLVKFVIDKKGDVSRIQAISSEKNKSLQEEAKRIIRLLPKFIPGKHNNKSVDVLFNIPMEFKIEK
ncbi:energy transducer TonB [Tenacibaculum sp. C7A-26P2]|uniref:energy transducer TonB n=1 Tax=Tenacibaculum sp. C7A-26P2 TaxID=3447504 RepID=UPI003F833F75